MLKNYLKITWKVLGRNKFFTFVSLFGISFTIGVLLVVATFLDSVFGNHYPELNRDRSLYIFQVRLTNDRGWNSQGSAGFYFLDQYVRRMKTPAQISLTSTGSQTNTFVGDKKLAITLKYTCENFWHSQQFDFLEGRGYSRRQLENNEHLAVISKATRDAYFGKGAVVGRYIETDNIRYRVIGVVRDVPASQIFTHADIYVPYTTARGGLSTRDLRGDFLGILTAKNKGDLPKIKAEFETVVKQVSVPADSDYQYFTSWALTPVEIVSMTFFRSDEPSTTPLYILLATAMLLFMSLPALNLVNLNSSRIMERSSEIGVRKAFGATSSTLALQFIVENIALTLLGGVIGLILAYGVLQMIEASQVIEHAHFYLNYKVFIAALLLCLLFGLLSGVLPAVRMSKIRIVHALQRRG